MLIKHVIYEKCVVYLYCYFFYNGIKYEPYLFNDCHDLIQNTTNFIDIANILIKESDYRFHF